MRLQFEFTGVNFDVVLHLQLFSKIAFVANDVGCLQISYRFCSESMWIFDAKILLLLRRLLGAMHWINWKDNGRCVFAADRFHRRCIYCLNASRFPSSSSSFVGLQKTREKSGSQEIVYFSREENKKLVFGQWVNFLMLAATLYNERDEKRNKRWCTNGKKKRWNII